MDKNSTILGYNVRAFYTTFFLIFFFQTVAIGQTTFVYANQVTSYSHVVNENNAIVNDNSYATLNSYGGVAVGIGNYSGRLELEFPSTLPAGKTSYVRLDFDSAALNVLLGGNLGGALADLTGSLVLGNHYFVVRAKNNATTVLTGSSQSGFINDNMKLILDSNGYYYMAITPNQAYNRVEIEDFTDALLLGTANSMKVFYAFYTQGNDVCDLSFATSFDGTGGTLDILGLGGAGVAFPERAIDHNMNTYSDMSLGVLTAAGTINQTVYFSSLSNPTDQFQITLKLDNPALLNLGLTDGIKIEALNGTNVVFTYDLGSLLDLDLLGLLSSSQKVTIPFTPGQSFDRVRVSLSSLVQLNLVKELKIYEITRSPGVPTIPLISQNVSVCTGASATVTAQTDNANELVWYASAVGGVPLAITPYNGSYTTGILLAQTTIYVAARKIGCLIESGRVPIVINVLPAPVLNVQATLSGCGSVNLKDAILNFDASGNTTYSFFDATNTPLTAIQAASIQSSGVYYIQASSVSNGCASAKLPVTVTINSLPTLQVSPTNYTVNVGSTVTLLYTSNASVTWYDPNGVALPSNVAGPFAQAGNYTFTAVANNGLCSKSASVVVTVLDPSGCPIVTEKVFADTQSSASIITGTVFNDANAIDHDLQTYSTISSGLGLLGVGTTWQTLQWNTTIAAGTPVTIKLGSQYSGINLAGIISVVGTKRNGSGVPIDIGLVQPLSGSVLNLLSGENSFEYTFVPSDVAGPQAYDGVRVIVNSVLSVSLNAKVYEAYYTKVANPIVCQTGDVEDIFYGAVDLGVGALTSTVDVINPWNAVDNSDVTFATMHNGVGVLAAAEMTVKFRTPSTGNDVLKILISKPGTLLSASVLSGLTIQRYMGTTPVGGLMVGNGTLLTAQVIGGGTSVLLVSNTASAPYDRVQIRFGGTLNVLDFLQIHTIKREALVDVVGSGGDNIIEVCSGAIVAIAPQPCTSFVWYDAEYGGNVVNTGNTYTVPANLPAGTYVFYIQTVRNGCEVLSRTKITIIVGATAPGAAIASILINSGTTTTFCSPTGSVTLTAQLNSLPVLTNPIFHWYSFDGTNQILIPGQTTSTLVLNGLSPGTYTYYVGVSSDEFCETALGERASITFTILPFSTANDIVINDVQQCLNSSVVLQPSSSLTNPVYTWYFSNNTSLPIVNGTFAGITYAIAPNGTLTITGLTVVGSPYTYYVAVSSATTCQNLNGTFQDVTVIIKDGATPTTSNSTQSFCLITNPTVANIQVVGTAIVWYDAAVGGNVVASTTPLVNGMTYYAAQTDPITGCVSSVRLAVTVIIKDGATPTTSNSTQSFCLITNPTVANIQVVGTAIVWYDAAVGGNVVASTTPLVNGMTYYAAQTDPITGCVSSVRLAVTVIIKDGATPTTSNSTQSFCASDNPTVANIQVVGTAIVWYDAAVGGNVVASTTPLVNGMTYYAAQTDPITGCVSSIRLAVTVQVKDGATPTTSNSTQSFCASDNPTVANIQVVGTAIVWYDAAVGGNVVASATPLVNGMTYYAAQADPITGCVSSVRLAVTVQLKGGASPTTTNPTQTFCASQNPTIANLQVNQTGITWYDAASGGNVLPSTTILVNGATYYASMVDAATGCKSSVRLAVTVQFFQPASATITGGSPSACIRDQVTYSTAAGMTNYVWTVSTGGQIISGGTATDNTITIAWNQNGNASVSVSFTDTHGCGSNSGSFAVNVHTCSNLWITKTVNNMNPFVDDTIVFTITVNNTGTTSFQNVVVNEQIQSGFQYISYVASNGTYNPVTGIWNIASLNANEVATLNITVKVLFDGNHDNIATIETSDPDDPDDGNVAGVSLSVSCLVIFNEFTPNGDSSNDFFNIKCAEYYPHNKLDVYNRYGSLVYTVNGYKNNWKGIANVDGTFDGKVLPSGTYYYVFDIGDSMGVKTGWLYIMR